MLSFHGLVQDDCDVFGLKPVSEAETDEWLGTPWLLYEEVVQENVVGLHGGCCLGVFQVKNSEV